MKPGTAGISLSAAIHTAFGLAVYCLATALPRATPPVTIDLSVITGIVGPAGRLNETATEPTRTVPPAKPATAHPQPLPPPLRPAVATEPEPKPIPEPGANDEIADVPVEETRAETEPLHPEPEDRLVRIESTVRSSTRETGDPSPAPPEAPAGTTEKLTPEGSNVGTKTADGTTDSSPPLQPEEQWLREHFSYVKEVINRGLAYPTVARRNGWQGRVLVCFVICPDGSVEDIHIEQGSGFALLDKNAIATIRRLSPFPAPPVRATLLVPIDYKLS